MIVRKLALIGVVVFTGTLLLSGCGKEEPIDVDPQEIPRTPVAALQGGAIKSLDGGETFESRVRVKQSDKTIAKVDAVRFVMDARDGRILYLGSYDEGLFISRDSGDTWEFVTSFPGTKVYGIALHPKQANTFYVSGVVEKRAKVFRTDDGGQTWREIYAEPAKGSVILSLALNPYRPDTIYVGTSEGVMIVSDNGGVTWKNLKNVGDPVTDIIPDPFDAKTLYIHLHKGPIHITRDGGETFQRLGEGGIGTAFDTITGKAKDIQPPTSALSFALDPNRAGVFYVGTKDALYRGLEYGKKWEQLPIIESSASFPVRAIAISPKNSQELIYAAAETIYKTVDGGTHWSMYELEVASKVDSIIYDWLYPNVILMSLRN